MVTKLNQSFYKLLLWISIMVAILSACTAEGCEYCDEDIYVTRVVSFGYSPTNAIYGDTVSIKVVIVDSIDTNFEFYWSAYQDSTELKNIGEFITGERTSDVFIRSNQIDVYKTTTNQIDWIAEDEAVIHFKIYKENRILSPVEIEFSIKLED